MYESKYYTCEEIDERLLKGYYDDAVSKGYNDTFEQFKTELASIKDIAANKNNIEVLSKDLSDEIDRSTKMDQYLDDKHSRGKIFCKGILEYKQTPSENGYYLQKDIDGDLVCLTKHTSGTTEYIDTPIGKIFVVDDNLYVRDAFKIIPVGYTHTVVVAATPMDNVDDIGYTITGNNLDSPSKKIELTSIK